uniref:Uncharacterized protein n=1 Tax=Anguilla anguilla TaxID=7936 RepID=A0A0E9VUE5_ANGAN
MNSPQAKETQLYQYTENVILTNMYHKSILYSSL